MQHSIQVKEKPEPHWKFITAVLLILTVLLFATYWNMADVFWSGITRLASFICFAAAVMSGLKAMEGSLDLKVMISDDRLTVNYYKKGKNIQENVHDRADISEITYIRTSSLFSQQTAFVFTIRFKDAEQDFELFHFGGRSLHIRQADTQKLIGFLKEHGLSVNENTKTPTNK